jgi:hypothetical protein
MPLALYVPPEIPAFVRPATQISTAPGPARHLPARPDLGMRAKVGGHGGATAATPKAPDGKPSVQPQNTCQLPVGAPVDYCGLRGGGPS